MKKHYGQIKAERIYKKIVEAVNNGNAAFEEGRFEGGLTTESFYTKNHKIIFTWDYYDEEIIEATIIYQDTK